MLGLVRVGRRRDISDDIARSILVGTADSPDTDSQRDAEGCLAPIASTRGEAASVRGGEDPNANLPAGLAAARDGRILYSEFWGGRIRIIRPNGTVDPKPWADVNRLYGIRWTRFYHGGLSGIAFDPEFERNRFVYVVTQTPSKRNGLPSTTLILRFKEVAGRGTSPRVLYRIRAKVFDNVYSLVFGPDGTLFIPSGFLGTSRPKARIRSRIGAERSSASRETLHRR